ncbi:MAG TPA: EamA family transporter [Spirochaeta sp.]|nr:EamA family transporter [Spirochaeta sp.]
MSAAEWIMLIALSILWGGSFFFTEVALKSFHPFTIVFLRVFIAAVIMNIIVPASGIRMPSTGKIWAGFLILGLLNNAVPFSLIVWGQTSITGGMASILNATTPFFTVIAAHFFTSDEKLSLKKIIGVIIGFSGVIVLIGFGTLENGVNELKGQLAILGASCSYAFAGIFARRFKTWGLKPMQITTGQLSCSSLLMLPIVLLIDKPWTLAPPQISGILAVAGAAVLSTCLAYLIYFRVLSSAGATNVLLVTFIIPVSAIILGILFLNEQIHARHFIGMAVIGLGMIAIDGRLLKRRSKA